MGFFLSRPFCCSIRGNYDRIAPYYDTLAGLVFGRAIRRSQQFLLQAVPAHARVLTVGGGTGWILEELAALHPQGLEIDYVESSAKMLQLARARQHGQNKVTFIHSPIQEVRLAAGYTCVITPFLLDNFSAPTLRQVVSQLDNLLQAGGRWLQADFNPKPHRRLHRGLLRSMYIFFSLFCRIETRHMTDPTPLFAQYAYSKEAEAHFYRGFITATVYRKP